MCVCVSRKLHLRRQCVMKTHETPYNIKAKRKVEPPHWAALYFAWLAASENMEEKDRKAQVLELVLLKARQIMREDIWIWFASVTTVPPLPPALRVYTCLRWSVYSSHEILPQESKEIMGWLGSYPSWLCDVPRKYTVELSSFV